MSHQIAGSPGRRAIGESAVVALYSSILVSDFPAGTAIIRKAARQVKLKRLKFITLLGVGEGCLQIRILQKKIVFVNGKADARASAFCNSYACIEMGFPTLRDNAKLSHTRMNFI